MNSVCSCPHSFVCNGSMKLTERKFKGKKKIKCRVSTYVIVGNYPKVIIQPNSANKLTPIISGFPFITTKKFFMGCI